MDTALKIDKTEHLAEVWRGSGVRELKEEYVVPDSMPDVSEILSAQGILTVQGKDTNTGAVEIKATASLCFLYAAEDGSLRGLELALPADAVQVIVPDARTAMALASGTVPPTANLREPDPELDLDYTPLAAKTRDMHYALSNSLGFGGHNACVAFAHWEAPDEP